MQRIAFDSHKHYTLASVEGEDGRLICERQIPHERGALQEFLRRCDPGSPAVETTGNWYWIVDEIEGAGCRPRLVHARKAKLMLGMINKTDKLDARGLNRLQRAGTLPAVWIPPSALRDQRDLPRTRMVLVRQRTRLKNRIHAALAKYAMSLPDVSDLFGRQGTRWLQEHLGQLPPQTAHAAQRVLEQIETLDRQGAQREQRMSELFAPTAALELLRSVPGVGFILGVVIRLEVGDVSRFPRSAQLAAYAGTTPRVHPSGGRTRYGPLRPDVNRYLKGAFGEAANVICRRRARWPDRHVTHLYQRIARRRGHQTAIGAVARHLAEATYWILTKEQPSREPRPQPPQRRETRVVHGGVSAPMP